ncbi:MAG: hypothetical protein ABW088_16835 [Sedimenticola sp.]
MKSILKSWTYPLLLLVSLGLPALPASASLDDGALMLTLNHTFGKNSSKLTIGYQQLESVDLNAYSGFNLSADFTLERQDLHLKSFRFGLLNSDWHYESDIGLKFITLENQWRLNSRISDDLYSLNVDLAPSGLLDGNPEEMIVNISKSRIAKDLLRIAEKKIVEKGKAKKKPSLKAHKEALEKAHKEIGSLPKGKQGKWGSPQRGDKYKGYRLDDPHPPSDIHPPGSPGTKRHIDWWDRPSGKRKGDGSRSGKIPVED